MIEIKNSRISVTRGDTLRILITLKDSSGNDYVPQEGDVIRFAMKKTYQDQEVLIRQIIPNDTLLLDLSPSDTKELAYGQYVYDIEMTYANGDVDTFIKGQLNITEEVD